MIAALVLATAPVPAVVALDIEPVERVALDIKPVERADLDPKTVERILQHSPLPPPPADPTNRVADSPDAARLGRFLFFDTRLSRNGAIACATCHDPKQGFADGKPMAQGLGTVKRHAPSLWNVAQQRWLFWDGRADSLWSQAPQPIENDVEMGGDRLAIAKLVAGDDALRAGYERVFGTPPDLSDTARFPAHAKPEGDAASAWDAMGPADQDAVSRVFANVGKSLEAFERKLVSDRSRFDFFAKALREHDVEAQKQYPESALRGLVLFEGRANCRLCHAGPLFSDGEFHNIGVPTLDKSPPRDPGRREGIQKLARDPFNAAGPFSDDPRGPRAQEMTQLSSNAETWGQFRTPSLRNVARTAPYMQQGQFATLDDVLHYYSTLEGSVPAGHHGEQVIQPLHLTDVEIADLRAFLETLTDEVPLSALRSPPTPGELRNGMDAGHDDRRAQR
jgi:cytochrome c peroxidase